jgi:hypothetical protein
VRQRYPSEYARRPLLLLHSMWALALLASLRPIRRSIPRHMLIHRQREDVIDQLLRDSARRSLAAAPPTLSATLRLTLTSVTIAPLPSSYAPSPSLAGRLLAAVWSSPWITARYGRPTERQRRAALRKAGALSLVLLFGGLSLALNPAEVVTLLGLASALLLALLAVGHLLVTAVGAVMGNAVVACVAIMLYTALAALWVRLVRHPVEA